MTLFLKNCCAGLFMQTAVRSVVATDDIKKSLKSGSAAPSGRYLTKFGSVSTNIHPTSTLYQRNPAPKAVCYTEVVVTKKVYLRGATQIREEWIQEFIDPKIASVLSPKKCKK